mmetsp:Transcript_5269/g.17407  ORF Transcript_5269/g.17407 Transcript_5269/m.17407 type:complete len:234 (-) Transcript_5269:1536-2237(-)
MRLCRLLRWSALNVAELRCGRRAWPPPRTAHHSASPVSRSRRASNETQLEPRPLPARAVPAWCPSPPLRSPPHPHPRAGGVAAQAAAEVRVCAFGPRGAPILLRHQRRATRPSALRRARHLRVAAARRDSAGHEPRDRVCKGAAVPAAAAWPPEGGSAVRTPAPRVDARLASVERGRLVDRPVVVSQLRRDETRRRPARVRRLLRLLPPRRARQRPQGRALRPRLRLHPPPPP